MTGCSLRDQHSRVCGFIDCKHCFPLSVAGSNFSQFWSSKNKKKPFKVHYGSSKEYLFNCTCGHEFLSTPKKYKSGKSCPYCSSKKMCDNLDCKECFKKSFASVGVSDRWSPKNLISPKKVFRNGKRKIILECSKCDCEYEHLAKIITRGKRCPCCSQNKRKRKDHECEEFKISTFDLSKKAKYWAPDNQHPPEHVPLTCKEEFWFVCECGDQILAKPGELIYRKYLCDVCKC